MIVHWWRMHLKIWNLNMSLHKVASIFIVICLSSTVLAMVNFVVVASTFVEFTFKLNLTYEKFEHIFKLFNIWRVWMIYLQDEFGINSIIITTFTLSHCEEFEWRLIINVGIWILSYMKLWHILVLRLERIITNCLSWIYFCLSPRNTLINPCESWCDILQFATI
jgi:hypothetical protein